MTTPNTTPLTYNSYISQIGTMAVVGSFTPTANTVINGVTYLGGVTYGGAITQPDTNFSSIVPQMLNYAELRIQRDLDLLPSVTSRSYALTAYSNQLQISVNDFVTIQTMEVADLSGDTYPLLPSSKVFIQNVFGTGTTASVPRYFAMYGGDVTTGGNTYNNIIVGPTPDDAYNITATGTIRTPTLYQFSGSSTTASSSTTFISTNLPDLLIMASMVYISAYQRNFGRGSDDPAMAQSYEGQYQALKATAITEEYRKKFQASAWSSDSNSPAATPTR
jgi:hypothetical protein